MFILMYIHYTAMYMRIQTFITVLSLSILSVSGQEKENSCATDTYNTDKGPVCGAIETTDASNKYKAFYGKFAVKKSQEV